MSVASACKVQFTPDGGDPLTLIDVGGWLTDFPKWDVAQDLFEVDGIKSATSYFKPLGEAVVTLTLGVEEDRPDDRLDSFIEAELLSSVTLLRVEGALVISSRTQIWTYSPAVIATITPGLPDDQGDPVLSRIYSIQCALPAAPASRETYLRPGGSDHFLRPDGTSQFLRP